MRGNSSDSRRGEADYALLSLFGVWLIAGLIVLTSASSVNRFEEPFFFVGRQIMFGLLPGILGFLFFSKISYEKLKKVGLAVSIISLLLLIAIFIPGVGADFGTRAKSWISFAGFSFQPAELAKLGTIFFLGTILGNQLERIRMLQHGFVPTVLLGLIPVGLIVLQPDIGSAAILFAIVFGMLFVAGSRMSHMAGLAGLAVAALGLLIIVAPYRAERLTTFLNPDANLDGAGYHIRQAQMAIGSGGVLGRGLGHSRQKHAYLPEVHADSIFAIMAEEFGFIVITGFLFMLFSIARQGMRLAIKAPDAYGRFVVSGIIIWFMIQSLFNIASMMGLMPITGVPLPFVSHGGTSLAIAMSAVGVLANLSTRRV